MDLFILLNAHLHFTMRFQYYLRFWLGICRTSLVVSALRIMRYCPIFLMAAISTDTE